MHSIEPRDATFALAVHRFLTRLSSSAISVFIWIILYMYFVDQSDSPVAALLRTLLLYALAQTITILVSPLVPRLLRGNMLRSLVFGTVIGAAALIYTGALAAGVFPEGAAIIGILLGLYRAFYRAPYEMEHRAMPEESRRSFLIELLLACMPLIAGAVVGAAVFYPHLLFAAAFINALSLLPLFFVLRVHETYSWGYHQTFSHLLDQKNQLLVSHSLLVGAAGAILFLLWPLALYFYLSPAPLALGATFSATLLVILFFRLPRSRVLVEQHADSATYVDEYTVLKEMALAAGRLGVSLIAALAVGMLY